MKGDGKIAVLGHVDCVDTVCIMRVITWVVWSLESAILCPETTMASFVRKEPDFY